MKKRTAIVLILLMIAMPSALAKLRGVPEITSVAVQSGDPDHIVIFIAGLTCKAGNSTNGGLTFAVLPQEQVPSNLVTRLNTNTRRYVLADPERLLRSDDAGLTWTNTAASAFLRRQGEADVEEEVKWFHKEYGARLPSRSSLWHPIFAIYAICYFCLTSIILRGDGLLAAILTSLRGLILILLVWGLLCGVYSVVTNWTSNQYPQVYWNTSGLRCPSPKLGIAMAIAALPLPLLVYLLFLWPILPGSKEVLSRAFAPKQRWLALVGCIAAGSTIAAFHLWMMFVGYFWE